MASGAYRIGIGDVRWGARALKLYKDACARLLDLMSAANLLDACSRFEQQTRWSHHAGNVIVGSENLTES